MAKRRARHVAAAAPVAAGGVGANDWIVCAGYTLAVSRQPGCVFQLDVQGKDGNTYFFRVVDPNDKVGFVQQVLRIIADRWPSPAFEFKAADSGEIIDIK